MARGMVTLQDVNDAFVQAQDMGAAVLTVVGTATQTVTSTDQVMSGLHKGAMFYVNITTCSATMTVAWTFNAKDPISGSYFPLFRASVDGTILVSGYTGKVPIYVYPGIVTSVSVTSMAYNLPLPRTFQVVASITATANSGGANIAFTMGQTRLV